MHFSTETSNLVNVAYLERFDGISCAQFIVYKEKEAKILKDASVFSYVRICIHSYSALDCPIAKHQGTLH